MRAGFQGAWSLIVAGGLALPAWGQGSWVQSSNPGSSGARQAQTPFTAEYKITRVRTLANGTTITRESTEVRAVDSEGRVMESRTETPASEDRKPVSIVSVSDPVAKTRTHWNSPGDKATVIPMPPHLSDQPGCFSTAANSTPAAGGSGNEESSRGVGGSATSSSSSFLVAGGPEMRRGKPVIEDLGTSTVQGIEARGRPGERRAPGAYGRNLDGDKDRPVRAAGALGDRRPGDRQADHGAGESDSERVRYGPIPAAAGL